MLFFVYKIFDDLRREMRAIKKINEIINFKKSKYAIFLIAILVLGIIITTGIGISKVLEISNLNVKLQKEEEMSQNEAKVTLENAITNLKNEQEGKGFVLQKEDLPKINNNEIDVRSVESFPIKVICRNYEFSVDENFQVTYVGNSDETMVTYTTQPSGYTNKDKLNVLIKVENESGIRQIENRDGNIITPIGKNKVAFDNEVTGNGTHTIKVIDGNGKEVTKDIVIDLIDKEPPLAFTPVIERNGINIKIIANAQDADATETSTKSGISRYEYYVDNKYYSNNEINNLKVGNHTVYVIAYDRAGNKRQCDNITVNVKIDIKEISTHTGIYSSTEHSHNLAIDESGRLYAWGINTSGQIGNGTSSTSERVLSPINIEKENTFKKIATNYDHSFAIDESGQLWAWGLNSCGQLGDGTTDTVLKPKPIIQGKKFKEISAGYAHTLAIDEDGNLWTWGKNDYGQLGDGTRTRRGNPQQIQVGIKYKEISAGRDHSMAIDESGQLWAWGYGLNGRLGDGQTTRINSVPILIKTGIKKIVAGDEYTLAIDEEGNLWSWGGNTYGELGNGTSGTSANVLTPTKVPVQAGTKFKEIAAGRSHTLAIDESGNLWGCGSNSDYKLGLAYTGYHKSLTLIKSDTKFKKVEAGYAHSLAIDEEGNLWAWGKNTYGQLGNGTTTTEKEPICISIEGK